MTDHRRRVDQILDEKFVGELAGVELAELRRRRRMCDDVETELSYYRRLLHGRMDLLAFELRRRRGEDDRTLLEALPDILAGQERPGGHSVRQVPVEAPDVPDHGRRAVDKALGDDFLTRLPSIADDELESIQTSLADTEREVSAQRRKVYEVCERVQAELTRRYREGLADPDELLRQS